MNNVAFGIILAIYGAAMTALNLYITVSNRRYARLRDVRHDEQEAETSLGKRFSAIESKFGLVTDLDKKAAVFEVKLQHFSEQLARLLLERVHSPHTPRLDNLIDKFLAGNIEDERDLIELERLLLETREQESDPKRLRDLDGAIKMLRYAYAVLP